MPTVAFPSTMWQVILIPAFLFQMFATAVCIVLSLGDMDFGDDARRTWLRLLLHTLCMGVLLTVLQGALLFLSERLSVPLTGVNFSIATLVGLVLYAAFVSRYTK